MSELKFKFQWKVSKEDISQLIEFSKTISRRFWTVHDNVVLEWRAEFSLNAQNTKKLDFAIMYIDGPQEKVDFRCSLVAISSTGTTSEEFVGETPQQLSRGGKFLTNTIGHTIVETGTNMFRTRLSIPVSSFDDVKAPLRTSESLDAYHWMRKLFWSTNNAASKYSDVRLVSGDDHTFYCHRLVFVAQSEAMDAIFQNAQTEEEKNGTFRLSAWSTAELRSILEYFYKSKPFLALLSIQQLKNVYDFAEQHNLDNLKKFIYAQLWTRAEVKPIDCKDITRFADLHADKGLNPLKYRCFDVLTENYSQLGLKVDDIFNEDAPGTSGGEPPPKKARGVAATKKKKEDEVGIRLKNELMEYSLGRIEGEP